MYANEDVTSWQHAAPQLAVFLCQDSICSAQLEFMTDSILMRCPGGISRSRLPVLESEAEEVFGHAEFPRKKFESVSKSLKVSDLRWHPTPVLQVGRTSIRSKHMKTMYSIGFLLGAHKRRTQALLQSSTTTRDPPARALPQHCHAP
jgi:hypothetical protein